MFTESLNAVDPVPGGWLRRQHHLRRSEEVAGHHRAPASSTNGPATCTHPEELKIERSLSQDVSLHFDNALYPEVIKRLGSLAEVNIFLDTSASRMKA